LSAISRKLAESNVLTEVVEYRTSL